MNGKGEKMKNFVKRVMYFLFAPKNMKKCKKCCLFCKWFKECSDDVVNQIYEINQDDKFIEWWWG